MSKNCEAIFKSGLPHRAICVWLYLNYRSNSENFCFPSVRRICADIRLSRMTVYRALNDLTEAGVLQREARYHTEGGRRSSIYRL